MVAYSYKREFEDPIRAKTKQHTIRADRKRHARPGEQIQHYVGMRTRQCRKLGVSTCTVVIPIRLYLEEGRIETETGAAYTTPEELDHFARSDGFPRGWRQMRAFWKVNHPGIDVFSGVLIGWGDTFVAANQGEALTDEDGRACAA